MNIKCRKCGKIHDIPDAQIENKKIFFFCDECNHKITIDGRKNIKQEEKTVLLKKNDSSLSIEKNKTNKILNNDIPKKYNYLNNNQAKKNIKKLTFSNLISNVSIFFNRTSIFIGFIYGIFASLLIGLTSLIILKNIAYFSSNKFSAFIFIYLILLILLYTFYLTLYFISKIHYSELIDNKKIDWGFLTFDIKEDSISLLIISTGFITFLLLIVLSFSALGSAGFLINAILLPVTIILSLFVLLSLCLLNYIPAYISLKSLYVLETFTSIKNFIKTEVINIPIYTIIINIISTFISSIVLFFLGGAYILSLNLIISSLSPSLKADITNYIKSLPLILAGAGSTVSIDISTKAGIIILLLISFLFFIFCWSLIVNIKQSLIVKACNIMIENPGDSINKKSALIIISLLVIGVIALIYLSGFLFKNFNRFY